MYGNPPLAAALAIALEPTGWMGAGTVCRSRDHRDKKMQDYIVASYRVALAFRRLCSSKLPKPVGSLLPAVVSEVHKPFNTNLSLGSLFLLYYNVVAACHDRRVCDIRTNATYAYSLLVSDSLVWLFDSIRELSPSHVRSSRSPFWPNVKSPLYGIERERYTGSSSMLALKLLSRHDPIFQEASTAFVHTSKLATEYLRKHGCQVPSSSVIDELFKDLCSNFVDSLLFRKRGLERALEVMLACKAGSMPKFDSRESLGSIADLVTLVLYYISNECAESWFFLKTVP
uniref:Triphosphoribosyl-dephospho-CoA synthase n=1 Tax=Fervidicoccus fontis TaxID=683846 RepID=A0A7J3ZJD6_9CREN